MPIPQQKFREIVFQLLYSINNGFANENDLITLIMGELNVTKNNVKKALERVHEIIQKQPKIDPLIESMSTTYDFERIQTVTKDILRLGVFELLYDSKIPPKVAITEAMRLARKFGAPESGLFVNAILDQLHQKTDQKELE